MADPRVLRGINLVGLEGGYGHDGPDTPESHTGWDRSRGPRAGTDYPVHAHSTIDYYRSKNIRVFRLLFSWERMQADLWGPVPAHDRYREYFDHVKDVVDHATGLGIVVILEPWQADSAGGAGGARWRGGLVGTEVDRYAFADFWAKLATLFRDNPLVEYGLVNEPNHMSTMDWWTTAQKCIDYIRAAGAETTIYVPGNGYTAALYWTDSWYDAVQPQRSNAYGYLNVNGEGAPLWDPLHRSVIEVHIYLDPQGSGSTAEVQDDDIALRSVRVALDEADRHGYRVFVGEIGCYAVATHATTAWRRFVDHTAERSATCAGYAWWAGGSPGSWDDVDAHDGGHFAVTPVRSDEPPPLRDTVNMTMIEQDFV